MIQINKQLESPTNKPILYDVFSNPASKKQPLVVFCHGYKGFKDWGAWHLVAKAFMKANCCFVKFNFTHNGGTIEQPIDFPDLNAFAENNYTKELTDLKETVKQTKTIKRKPAPKKVPTKKKTTSASKKNIVSKTKRKK